MNKTKEIWISGFALFSMFFGAGNLILPPFLGFKAGGDWFWVALGFSITAVVIPLLGILAHARLQGTMFDFGKKVSPTFSLIYCLIVYAISVALPAPRTASVTYEMAIEPFLRFSNGETLLKKWLRATWNTIGDLLNISDSLLTSIIYFVLVLMFVMNRSKILSLIGKYLTPLIVLILLSIIAIAIASPTPLQAPSLFEAPIVDGLLEGYQTFDAIGAVVVGAVIIISLQLRGHDSFEAKKELITKSGFIAGAGLFIIYTGLILSGALFNMSFEAEATRTEVLAGLSTITLGNIGTTFLSVLVALACFTTAVGIITGTADYFKGLFKESPRAYTITALLACLIGIAVGQFDVHYIIDIALPALMFIYPITIVLILLNVVPVNYASPLVFKVVVAVTFLFSIPDFLQFIIAPESLVGIKSMIPLSQYSLGWVLPALVAFVLANMFRKNKV